MQKLLLTGIMLAVPLLSGAAAKTYSHDGRQITVDTTTGAATVIAGNDTILKSNLPAWGLDNEVRRPDALRNVKTSSRRITDCHGDAMRVTVSGSYNGENVNVDYDIYPEFVLTRLTVDAPSKQKEDYALNYLAPVATRLPFEFANRTGNYAISVPYDNDAWVRYTTAAFGDSIPASYEVAAIFNADTRKGLIVGSVEHDIWKSGIKTTTDGKTAITSLEAFGGITSDLTRDKRSHGHVRATAGKNGAKSVKSPRIILISADDWRDGLELFADQCALYAPSIPKKGPRPFGWNSWGKLQTKINYDKAVEVSDFIHDNLMSRGFHDADNNVVIDLDAFWDYGFKPEQHRQFVEHCHANGQKAGIYYCPFTDWGKNPKPTVAEMPQYKMGDLYLRVNGEPVIFDGAPALDPTHPATKARIKRQMEQFIDWGYEYVKIDFMAHGAYESDTHFDPNVTTGTQAYCQGMAYLDSIVGDKMWINLSIAPLFPANYANSRRISCDAWNTAENTEYVLNALTGGWWLDHVYHNNDADHVVYEGATDGENRMRISCSAITGVYFLGDDMSKGGSDDTKQRVIRNTGNSEINEMARNCKSFRPVEHGEGAKAADMFTNSDDNYIYVAIFNYDGHPAEKTLPLRRLGLSEAADYSATELWSHDPVTLHGAIHASLPPKDVKIYKINKL